MLLLCITILVIGAVTIFSVQNALAVTVTFLTWKFSVPFAFIVFTAFVIGISTTILFSLALRFRHRKNQSPLARIGYQSSVVSQPNGWNDYRTWLSAETHTEAPRGIMLLK
jgi:uncharacterized integral membrane protein